jgi:hypothetical protein
MTYQSQTQSPILRELFTRLMPGLMDTIDIPPDLQAALRKVYDREDTVPGHILNGSVRSYEASLEEQTRVAIICCNVFRLLLEAHVAASPKDSLKILPIGLRQVSDNLHGFLCNIDEGAAWVALRNAYGGEYANRGNSQKPNTWHFIQFAAKHWMPLMIKIRKYMH